MPNSSSSTTNFPWLSPCLLVRALLPLLFITCNCFTYTAKERTWTYSKHISCDRYPARLLARRKNVQKTHVTWSLSTVVTSPRTRKTQFPLFLRNLATDYLPVICLRGNFFTNTLASNGCTCNIMFFISYLDISCCNQCFYSFPKKGFWTARGQIRPRPQCLLFWMSKYRKNASIFHSWIFLEWLVKRPILNIILRHICHH
jgi:hypothetical protein